MSTTDRVLPLTRAVAIAIVPFLVVAVVILFGFPSRTEELFAWAIAPPLSAYLLASAYVGGIWFFGCTAFARSWDAVRHGFPAVVVFAGALLVATLLHLDRFSRNLPFVVWLVLYATTPFLVAAVAVIQRRRAAALPPSPLRGEVLLSMRLRVALLAVGGAAVLCGAGLFVFADVADAFWAWPLTPLTARVTGAVLSLPGVVAAGLVRDLRWSAFRVLLQAQLVSLVAIAVSFALGWADLRWERPVTWLMVALVVGALALYAAVTIRYERAARRVR